MRPAGETTDPIDRIPPVLQTNRTIRTIVSLAVALTLVSCAPNRPQTGSRQAEFTASSDRASDPDAAPAPLLPDRIYAIEGERLVITVGSPMALTGPLTTDTGEQLPTRLFLVTRAPLTLDPLAWLTPAGGWDATEHPLGQPTINENGLWMVLVDLPDAYENRPLLMNGRRLPVLWLPEPPPTTESRAIPRLNASASAWRELGDILTPLRNDPAQRWRVRLLTDRVRPDRLFGSGGDAFNEKPIENELLEALARQTELRYRVAVARIQLADARAAAQLVAMLTTVVAMPDGQLLPAWTDITPRVSTIIDTAINTARSPARAAEAVRSLTDALSPVRGWVIDDASLSRDGEFQTTLGIANLSIDERRASAGAANQAFTRSADIAPHTTASVRSVVVIDPPRSPTEPPAARPMDIRVESPRERHPLLTPAQRVQPPGQTLTPTFLPWTRVSWLAQRPIPAPRDRQTAVLIQQSPDTGAWEVFVEATTTTNALEQPPANDIVRIWLGPYGRSEGYLLCGPGATRQLTGAEPPPVRLHAWGWSSAVPIPQSVIGEQDIVHIAVERIDADGYRSTWPRPVLPSQAEPGRAAFTLTPWSGALTGRE